MFLHNGDDFGSNSNQNLPRDFFIGTFQRGNESTSILKARRQYPIRSLGWRPWSLNRWIPTGITDSCADLLISSTRRFAHQRCRPTLTLNCRFRKDMFNRSWTECVDINVDIIRNEAVRLSITRYIVSSIYKTNLLAYCCTVVSFVGIIFLVLTLDHVPCPLC